MSHVFRRHMENARRLIEQGGPLHPLAFLLSDGGRWAGRFPGTSPVAVQAGHATSRFSGLAERFLVEDADYNHMRGTVERRGDVLTRQGVLVGGVPVELETARYWRDLGFLRADIDALPPTIGWS